MTNGAGTAEANGNSPLRIPKMAELVSQLGDRCAVYRGHCLSYGEGITYWPVNEILKGAAGILSEDESLARALRRSPHPVLVVANKVDAEAQESLAAEFYGLGLGEPTPVSALHGRASGDLGAGRDDQGGRVDGGLKRPRP